MVNSKAFAERIEKILEFYGISATAFSEEIDFNRSTISHLLSGRNKPSLEFIMKVVERFPEVEIYWLLNGKGSFPSKKENTPSHTIPNNIVEATKKTTTANSNEENTIDLNTDTSEIERIVIFYKNGSFKSYGK